VLEFRKLGRVLHPGDPTDMYSLALEREVYLPALYVLFLPTGFLLAAGAFGAVVAARRHARDAWPVLAWPVVHFAVLMAFFVSQRLRMPLLFALLPLAGRAVVEIAEGLRRRSGRRAGVAIAAGFVVAATVVGWIATRWTPRDVVRLAAVLSARGELSRSLEVLEPVLRDPSPDALALDQAGWVLQQMGRHSEAAERYRQALGAGMPGGRDTQTRTRLAIVLERLGTLDASRREHDAAVASPRANAGTYFERGMFLLRRGDRDGAERDLREAVRMDPSWPPPRQALASMGR